MLRPRQCCLNSNTSESTFNEKFLPFYDKSYILFLSLLRDSLFAFIQSTIFVISVFILYDKFIDCITLQNDISK